MPEERNESWLESEGVAQRAITLQVLREDHGERWTRAELEREIYDVSPAAIGAALERLREEGVVHLDGEEVWASRCALHLDALGMVSI